MKQKLLALVLVLALTGIVLTGCAGGAGYTSDGKGNKESKGKTELILWSTYNDDGVEMLYTLVDKFNETSDEYHLTLEYGGTQAQIRQKLSTYDEKYFPSLFMCEPASIYDYEHGGYVKPLQDFLDADSDKWADDIFTAAKTAYSDKEGNMLGGIMGISAKGWFVNLDMLKEAGYTLDDLTSFEKVTEAATTAYKKGLCRYGYMPYQSFEIQNMLCYQGVDIFDNENGFTDIPTKCLMEEGETNTYLKKLLGMYAQMKKDGSYYNGLSGASGAATFINEQVLFWGGTNSYTYNIKDVNLPFEWAFLPALGIDNTAQYKNCAMPEGTGLFITKSSDEEQMKGAYEVIKFFAETENQLAWCTYRGYVPYTNEAANHETWTSWSAEKFPTAGRLMEQIESTPAELRLPYTPVAATVNTACSRLVSLINSDPLGNLDEYIKEVTANINNALKLLEMREQ